MDERFVQHLVYKRFLIIWVLLMVDGVLTIDNQWPEQ